MQTLTNQATERTHVAVNVAAIERNVSSLVSKLEGGSELCAVVKSDGYGHGAAAAAAAAQRGGASAIAVVTANEACGLRDAGVGGRLLVLGPLTEPELHQVLGAESELVVWLQDQLEAVIDAARELEIEPAGLGLHVKFDSGMGRLGEADQDAAAALCDAIVESGIGLAGVMTHFATADDLDDEFFAAQLERFSQWLAKVRTAHPEVPAHAANSAAIIREPGSHFQMVRAGVAIYGLDPFGIDPARQGLEPALEWQARIGAVKALPAGGSVGYGRRFIAERDTQIATVLAGYGDGLNRALGRLGGSVLIGGSPAPMRGTVSMDSFAAELQQPVTASLGELATIIGRSGDSQILAEEQAQLLQTINYEITCGIGTRVPRRYHRDGVACDALGNLL